MEMKEIIDRLMRAKNLNNIEFSKKIGVQRSNINHILSGRNNPGLSFFVKTLDAFPDLSAEWLLTGKGNMYKTGNNVQNIDNNRNTGNVDKSEQPQNSALSPTLFSELSDSAEKQPEKQSTDKKETIIPEKEQVEKKEVEKQSENISKTVETKPDPIEAPEILSPPEPVSPPKIEIPEKRIETVIIFNSDGTCKSYKLLN